MSSFPAPAPAPAAPDPRPVARASVDVGPITTHYLRAGCGEPILWLSPGEPGDSLAGGLAGALARLFRVIAPEPVVENGAQALVLPGGSGAPAFATWLRDFIDGLGLTQVGIVADGQFAVPALGFALSDPGRVGPLVLLFRDGGGSALAESASRDVLQESGHPLLVLRMEDEAVEPESSSGPVAELIRFLRGERAEVLNPRR